MLRADLTVTLEKSQHPIGRSRREIPVGIRISNTGTAAAENVTLTLMPSRGSEPYIEIKNAEARVAKIALGHDSYSHMLSLNIIQSAPAVELEYLASWSDPSSSDRSDVGKIKLIAQREVDWAKAKINPYSLRSITNSSRLYGRDDVLERLRIGIMGMQSFYLTGQRRVGKSSVARVLYNEFSSITSYISVYVTLGELTTSSVGALMYSLQKAIADNVPYPIRKVVMESLPTEADFNSGMGAPARSFFKALDQYVPGYKIICMIDDFDELSEHLYKGPDANALFLYFRTLIDDGSFSFVFIGSERLPEILRHQGERLNQVRRVNLDYLSNLADLVRKPSFPHLEYSDEAISLIHRYSVGNPYYATQTCMWSDPHQLDSQVVKVRTLWVG